MTVMGGLDLTEVLAASFASAIGPPGAALALAAVGLRLQYGAGRFANLGMGAFVAIGAYGTAVVGTEGWLGGSLAIAMLVGLTAAALVAAVVGAAIRGSSHAVVWLSTLALGAVVPMTLASDSLRDIAGGAFGLPSSSSDPIGSSFTRDMNPLWSAEHPNRTYGPGSFTLDATALWVALLGWGLVLAVAAAVGMRRQRSSTPGAADGRIDTDAPAASSAPGTASAHRSLIAGAVIGAGAGIVDVLGNGAAEPERYGPELSLVVWAVLLVGGASSPWGAVRGAIVVSFTLTAGEELTREIITGSTRIAKVIDPAAAGHVSLGITGALVALTVVGRWARSHGHLDHPRPNDRWDQPASTPSRTSPSSATIPE